MLNVWSQLGRCLSILTKPKAWMVPYFMPGMFPKGPCIAGLFSRMALFKSGGNFKRLGLMGGFRSLGGVSLKGTVGLLSLLLFLFFLFASQPPWAEQLVLPYIPHCDVLPHQRPQSNTVWPWTETSKTVKITISSFFLRYFCYSNRKMTNTGSKTEVAQTICCEFYRCRWHLKCQEYTVWFEILQLPTIIFFLSFNQSLFLDPRPSYFSSFRWH